MVLKGIDGIGPIPENKMVQTLKVEELSSLPKSFCKGKIFLGGGWIAGGVVMRKDVGATPHAKKCAEENLWVYDRHS